MADQGSIDRHCIADGSGGCENLHRQEFPALYLMPLHSYISIKHFHKKSVPVFSQGRIFFMAVSTAFPPACYKIGGIFTESGNNSSANGADFCKNLNGQAFLA